MTTKKKSGKKKISLSITKSFPSLSDKTKVHIVNPYISQPLHPVSVLIIGAGGNGSAMLTRLARIHSCLIQLGHPGLFIQIMDNDKVERFNIGRQMYSNSDIGKYKSTVIIERVNRFFGTNFISFPERLNTVQELDDMSHNLIISCVDNNATRKMINDFTKLKISKSDHREVPFYWIDMGNGKNRGQFNMSTMHKSKKNTSNETYNYVANLKSLIDIYGQQADDPDEPSCSMEESLRKQDLFVNDLLTTYVSNFLWKILHKPTIIQYQGMFLNFETNIHSEILIK